MSHAPIPGRVLLLRKEVFALTRDTPMTLLEVHRGSVSGGSAVELWPNMSV
jgi:hypothetical protein